LQENFAKIRYANGHYKANVIAIAPHHIISTSKRVMPQKRKHRNLPSKKTLMTYFSVDVQTGQPIIFSAASSGVNQKNSPQN